MLSTVGLVSMSSVVAQESQELRGEIVGSKEENGAMMRVESTLCHSLCVLAWNNAIGFYKVWNFLLGIILRNVSLATTCHALPSSP